MGNSHDKFVEYYKEASLQPETIERFERIRELVVAALGRDRYSEETLRVADVGCGTGVQATLWANDGHEVFGLDINQELVQEAKLRADEQSLIIHYCLGSANRLPWSSRSMDVCLVPELLEHVIDWQGCLDEFARILRPSGVIYLSTTNRLCPRQQEFALPFYGWYPSCIKKYCERLAVSTKPHWVNYAEYPAVNWFDYYCLTREFEKRGITSQDRVDLYAKEAGLGLKSLVSKTISVIPPFRFALQVATPYSQVIGTKLDLASANQC